MAGAPPPPALHFCRGRYGRYLTSSPCHSPLPHLFWMGTVFEILIPTCIVAAAAAAIVHVLRKRRALAATVAAADAWDSQHGA